MSSLTQIVQKYWNYCNILRDDGLSCGDCCPPDLTNHR